MSDQENRWKRIKELAEKYAPYMVRKKEEPEAVSNSPQIYSLNIISFKKQKYKIRIRFDDEEPFDYYSSGNYIECDFEQLQQLSTWFHANLVNLYFKHDFDDDTASLKRKVKAYRKIWNKIYPDAKIGFHFYKSYKKIKTFSYLIEELSSRLYNLECHVKALIKTPAKLTLNSCILNDDVTLRNIKKLMQKEHKIKTLEFDLGRTENFSHHQKWNKNFDSHSYLKKFPTISTLKHLEINLSHEDLNEKSFEPKEIETFLKFFPALTSFCLNISFETDDDPDTWLSMDETKEGVSNALNIVRELRQHLFEKMSPLFELAINYTIISAEITSRSDDFQGFNKWAKKLINHPELAGANKIEPQDGKHYENVKNNYYNISLSWNYKNFIGEFYYIHHMHTKSELGMKEEYDQYYDEKEESGEDDGESGLEEDEEESKHLNDNNPGEEKTKTDKKEEKSEYDDEYEYSEEEMDE